MDPLVVAVVLLAAALALSWWLFLRLWMRWRRRLREQDSAKRSQSTRYGRVTEQFAPFLEAWPWDPNGFRFLGTPVDGVQFTPEGVVFVEIKSAGGRLSAVQREVRGHVEAGRVAWREVRIG